MLDLNDLRTFARIADLGSLSGAARTLGIPKSSASRSLARLEGAAGAALIERSTRHLRPTDAGRLLQRHARRILDDVGETEDALTGLIGMPRGTLRVSVGFTFAVGPLAPMLPDSELIARRLTTTALWTCASPAYLAVRGTPTTVGDLRVHELTSRVDRRSTWRFRSPDGAAQEIEVPTGSIGTMRLRYTWAGRIDPDVQPAAGVGSGTEAAAFIGHTPADDRCQTTSWGTGRQSISLAGNPSHAPRMRRPSKP